jgi:DNA-binding beta-propeller fold protein YncE
MKITLAFTGLLAGVSAIAPAVHAQPTSDAAPYNVLKTYSAGNAFWDYGAFDATARRLYLGRENGVTAIDVDSGKVMERFVDGQQVHGIVLLDNNRALATNGAAANAMIFDRTTGKVVSRVPTGTKPDGAAIEPITGTVVIMDSISHDAVFADPNTAKVLGRLPLDGEPGTPIPDGKGHVFSGITDHSEIAMIDVASRTVLKKLPLPDCADSGGLALDPETGVLLVTCANLKAIAVDSHSGKILGSVPIDKYPDVILFDPMRKVFYVPTITPGNLFVIAEEKNGSPAIKAKVPLASGVHTEVLNSKDGLLYVPAGEIRIPKVQGERPTVAPGTFKVLVVNLNK